MTKQYFAYFFQGEKVCDTVYKWCKWTRFDIFIEKNFIFRIVLFRNLLILLSFNVLNVNCGTTVPSTAFLFSIKNFKPTPTINKPANNCEYYMWQ